jgi:hypothetical protein
MTSATVTESGLIVDRQAVTRFDGTLGVFAARGER